MARRLAAMVLALLAAACSAEQAGRAAQAACRSAPNTCTDREAAPASRSPGL
jgi:hypothetical protein